MCCTRHITVQLRAFAARLSGHTRCCCCCSAGTVLPVLEVCRPQGSVMLLKTTTRLHVESELAAESRIVRSRSKLLSAKCYGLAATDVIIIEKVFFACSARVAVLAPSSAGQAVVQPVLPLHLQASHSAQAVTTRADGLPGGCAACLPWTEHTGLPNTCKQHLRHQPFNG